MLHSALIYSSQHNHEFGYNPLCSVRMATLLLLLLSLQYPEVISLSLQSQDIIGLGFNI